MEKLEAILDDMGWNWNEHEQNGVRTMEQIIEQKRGKAKRIYYAFLFGAGGAKLWGYIFGTPDIIKGVPKMPLAQKASTV